MKIKTIYLSCLILLVSCLEKTEDKQEVSKASVETTQFLFENQKVTCEDPMLCPGYIAKVIIKKDDAIKVCTGFLIENNRIMTAQNCIQRDEFINCSENIRVIFPENQYENEVVAKCESISSNTGNTLKSNDIFFINIAPVERQIIAKNLDGIEDKQNVSIWKVDQEELDTSIVRKVDCQVKFKGLLAPESNSKRSARVTFGNCPMTQGNLGAPVVNESGQVVGIIDDYQDSKFINYVDNTLLNFEKKPEGLALAHNLSCMRFSENRYTRFPRSCSFPEDMGEPISTSIDKLINDIYQNNSDLQKMLENWDNHKPQIYQWKFQRLNIKQKNLLEKRDYSQILLYPDFACMNSPSKWIRHYYRRLGGLPKSRYIRYILPLYQVKFFLTQDATLSYEAKKLDRYYDLLLDLKLRDLAHEGGYKVRYIKEFSLKARTTESTENENNDYVQADPAHLDTLSPYFEQDTFNFFCQ